MNSTKVSSSNATTQSSSHSLSKILTLPQELFMDICEKLHPEDLYTLALVCKQFRNILWSNSTSTQQLWCNSRYKFLNSDLKLPVNLSEQRFIWLKFLGQTCQTCGIKLHGGNYRRFWEFKVLICSNCAEINIISLESLKRSNVSENVISCLPYISETIFRNSFNYLVNATSTEYRGINPYYWRRDVSHAVDEYNSLNGDEKEGWVNEKKAELKDYMKVIDDIRARELNAFLGGVLESIKT